MRFAGVEIGLITIATIAVRATVDGALLAEITASVAGGAAVLIAAFEIAGTTGIRLANSGTDRDRRAKEVRRSISE